MSPSRKVLQAKNDSFCDHIIVKTLTIKRIKAFNFTKYNDPQ